MEVDDSDSAGESSEENEELQSQRIEERLAAIQKSRPNTDILTFTSEEPLNIANINDDLEREVQFYAQTVETVKRGIAELDQAGIEHERPRNFFAPMAKNDEHMGKIKDKLETEQKRLEQVEKAKRNRIMSKEAKKIRAHPKRKGQTKEEVREEFVKKLHGPHSSDRSDHSRSKRGRGSKARGRGGRSSSRGRGRSTHRGRGKARR
ncbi:MAG: hypothetical protein EZS28_021792 [Streblomastix strix]|uniref:rRNA-processing protein EBP2 n=1 Tax=Streblomastix strix TaxID=222440 RepID=A0A5J4VJE6_9EUKA|nr:MAG: hypothetical protein EZS28_021792 [Streblomastix strix]